MSDTSAPGPVSPAPDRFNTTSTPTFVEHAATALERIGRAMQGPDPSAGVGVPDPSQELRDAVREGDREFWSQPSHPKGCKPREDYIIERLYPLVAAQVCAELVGRAAPNQVKPSDVIIVGARMTADGLEVIRDVEAAWVERVRAEERRRIAAIADEIHGHGAGTERDEIARLRAIIGRIAAGSAVPVATPEPATEFERMLADPRAIAWHKRYGSPEVKQAIREIEETIAAAYEDAPSGTATVPVATPTEPLDMGFLSFGHGVEVDPLANPTEATPSEHTDLLGVSVSDAIAAATPPKPAARRWVSADMESYSRSPAEQDGQQ